MAFLASGSLSSAKISIAMLSVLLAAGLASAVNIQTPLGLGANNADGAQVPALDLWSKLLGGSGAFSIFDGLPFKQMLKGVGGPNLVERHIKDALSAPERFLNLNDQPSTVDVIERSGFKYEIHKCTSVDGYVTELVRIINPLVAREHLRRIPVVLYTGQGTSPAAFLATALGSQGPAHWAPEPTRHSIHGNEELADEDAYGGARGGGGGDNNNNSHSSARQFGLLGLLGQKQQQQQQQHQHADHLHEHLLSASNRSLAAVLSNSGYDVWLVPTRGVDLANRRRVESANSKGLKRLLSSKQTLLKNALPAKPVGSSKEEIEEEMPLIDKIRAFAKSLASRNYWSFSSDEIIEFELEIQLEKVRLCTKSEKLSLITYSNGGFLTFGFLAAHPGYAVKHLDVIINLAPAVYVNRFNFAHALSGLLSQLSLPNSPFPADKLHALTRTAVVHVCKSESVTFSLCKLLLDQLYGPSSAEASQLSALLEFIGRPQSAQGLRQTLQSTSANRLAHYDHGLIGNLIFYEKLAPPDYELAAVNHPRLYIMAGERDAIVDAGSLRRLVAELGSKPQQVLEIKAHNHLDLLAAQDNALKVNAPILHILNDRYLELDYYIEEGSKLGAGEVYFDTSHNRLNANDTAGSRQNVVAPADYKNYHVSEQDNPDLHGESQSRESGHADGGFMIADHAAVDEELDSPSPKDLERAQSDNKLVSVAGNTTTPPASAAAVAAVPPVSAIPATNTISPATVARNAPLERPANLSITTQQQQQQQQQHQQQTASQRAGQVAQTAQVARATSAQAAASQLQTAQLAAQGAQVAHAPKKPTGEAL